MTDETPPTLPVDKGWLANAITAFFDGVKELVPGIKEILLIVLPLISIYLTYITKSQVSEVKDSTTQIEQKADVAATKADVAADVAAQVKTDLHASSAERKAQFDDLKKGQLKTAVDLAKVRATTTQDPEDMATARILEKQLEHHEASIAK